MDPVGSSIADLADRVDRNPFHVRLILAGSHVDPPAADRILSVRGWPTGPKISTTHLPSRTSCSTHETEIERERLEVGRVPLKAW